MAKRLYVGNLSYGTNEDSLRAAFEQFGEVNSVNVITDRDSGRSKGFAFVEMTDDAAAKAAIAGLNGTNLDGRDISVAEARPREDRGGGGGGGGGRRDDRGGYGGGRGGSRW